MPPESLPWDRKDFVREKKLHERTDSVGSVGRWRDSQYHGSRDFVRWGSEDFRRPPGHGKQGGYQISSEEPGRGGVLSRASERTVEEDSSFRPSATRGETKYVRNGREAKGSFSQRDWKGHPWENGSASFNSSSLGRQHDLNVQRSVRDMITYTSHTHSVNVNSSWENGSASFNSSSSGRQHDLDVQRSVSDMITYTSHTHSVNENSSWDHLHLKDQHNKMGSVNGLGTGHRFEKDQALGSIAWKPMKWNRSTSLSSRGSGFSHSSSSKSLRADSDESKPDLQSGRVTPVQSPSGDGSGGITSSAPLEDTCPRKKQRLGWGQGLAKYEKAKVEGSDETLTKNGLVPCSMNTKTSQGTATNVPDRSPRATGLSDCASPATNSSVACSSSPGLDDKQYNKEGNNGIDTCNSSGSPGHGTPNCLDEFSVDSEHLEPNSITNLMSLLNSLLQTDDSSYGDSNFVKSTAMNKVLLLKSELSKLLEKTEYEIDMFENELKLLNSASETNSLQVECVPKSSEEDAGTMPKLFQKPASLHLVSSCNMAVEKPLSCHDALEEVQDAVKDDDIDSPGTATSKFVDPLGMEKAVSAPCVEKPEDVCSGDAEAAGSVSSEQHCDLASVYEKSSSNGVGIHENDSINHGYASSCLSQSREADSKLSESVLACNRDSVTKAEVFIKLFPASKPQVDVSVASSILSMQNCSLVKEQFAMRKRFLRFKERVLNLKFRAFQHLWKEDMRLLSIRKHRAKSQKRFDLSSRTSHSGYQKHRSSIRSRFTLPAGNLTLVQTAEILNFTGKLLSDSHLKLYRNYLKMPALILDEKEKRLSRIITSNGLVEDPLAVEKERLVLSPWTPKEKDVFMEMFATFGKDFKKIASFLSHKTTADCVEFYYKNQKSECFEKIKKKSEVRKQGRSFTNNTYLVTSGKKWNREVNAASLELLGAASVIAARADDSMKTPQTYIARSFSGGHCDYKRSWDDSLYEKSGSVDILGNEKEALAADALAGICGALSSEAMSSCVTSSVDPGEGSQEWKFTKRNSSMDGPLTPEVLQNIDDEETCSDESCGELDSVDWTNEEKSNFIGALRAYGKDFTKISRCVGTRSRDQCKIFFSKARKCLGLDVICPGSINEGTPMSDAIEGRSDTEDAGVLEMESGICSTQSCSKVDGDLPLSGGNTNCGASEHAGTTDLQIDTGNVEKRNGIEQLDCGDAENGIEISVSDDCRQAAGPKPNLAIDTENLVNAVDKKLEANAEAVRWDDNVITDAACSSVMVSVCEHANLIANTKAAQEHRSNETDAQIEESACVGEVDHSTSNVDAETQAIPSACSKELMKESGNLHDLVPETDGKQGIKAGVPNCCRRSSSCVVPDLNTDRTAPCLTTAETSACPSLSLTSDHRHQISLDLPSGSQKGHTTSRQQKENCPDESPKSSLQDSSVMYLEARVRQGALSSTLNFDEPWMKKLSKAEGYRQYLMGQNAFNRVESSQVLRGYPLQALSKKEMNVCTESISSSKQTVVQNISKVNGSFQSDCLFVQDYYHEKSNGSEIPSNLPDFTRLSRSNEGSHLRSYPQSRAGSEEPSQRNGDVKLFGQILSHPSTLQKPSTKDSDKVPSLAKMSTTDDATQRPLDPTKLSGTRHSSLEDFPLRSYGYWDGNKIQTGLPSLPDSALLLAKYPAALTNYSSASSCGDQQSLPAVVKRNLMFPAKDAIGNGGGGVSDYNVCRGFDGTNLQPFMVNRHEVFSELQKRNGYEVPSFQQQTTTRIMVGGGSCGVSDPVAAIKMHYATAEGYSGGQGGSIREEDTWRGGDVGSR